MVEEGPVAHLLETVLLGAGPPVDVVSGIGLGNEDRSLGIHRKAIEQGAQGVDGLNQCVGSGVENIEVAVRDTRMLYDVRNVTDGEYVVVGDGMFVGIEGHEIAVDLFAAGQLGLVVRLEGYDVEPVAPYHDGSGVLSCDIETLHYFLFPDVDYRDLVFRGKRDVGLLVVGKGDSHGLVEASGLGLWVDILNGGHDMQESWFGIIEVNHADRIGNVIGHPQFLSIRPQGKADRIDAHVDAVDDFARFRVDDVDGVRGSVGHENVFPVCNDRPGMRTEKGRVTYFPRCGAQGNMQ